MIAFATLRKQASRVRATARTREVCPPVNESPLSRLEARRPISRPGAARRLLWLGIVLLTTVWMPACSGASAGPSLDGGHDSAEELVQAALNAMAAEDEEALRALLITRGEYETLLWPEMPDGEHTPFDFVWSLTSTNNRKGLAQALSEYGGMPLELVDVRFDEEPEVYQSFSFHYGAVVTVRRTDTGDVGTHPSFDVLVEYQGRWKLLNLDEL